MRSGPCGGTASCRTAPISRASKSRPPISSTRIWRGCGSTNSGRERGEHTDEAHDPGRACFGYGARSRMAGCCRGDAKARRNADLSDPGRRAAELRRPSRGDFCDGACDRADVNFHAGSRLPAAEVAASWQRIVSPPSGVTSARQAFYTMVDKVESPDPRTVVFRLQFATTAFLPALAA